MRGFLKRAFWNDDDGFSAKDFLMVLFGGLYALFLIAAFVMPLFGIVNAVALTIITEMTPLIMTIVGGVFAVQSVKEFRNPSTAINYQQPDSLSERDSVTGKDEQDEGVDLSTTSNTPRI
ncbi:hypothetical protein SECTIM467_55 [Brevibacillus phage SecTim467]|uniref:Uncharacterized protein n=2 Tax=Jenstvirus jenst TaxID=1982225 RepID=A0A0K2CP93_9CAUD|nr:hypothetical protein AVV11_gp136 [Brevibacillus phage Jenst]ALA07185.1 hypothetical protein JENST_55 [Brevibacillus phage Jenst]ALA07553.1 hypothetical protein SECTIM467_55 [Brevibacillus phage SecTim467]